MFFFLFSLGTESHISLRRQLFIDLSGIGVALFMLCNSLICDVIVLLLVIKKCLKLSLE